MTETNDGFRFKLSAHLDWLTFEQCAVYLSEWFGETVTVDHVRQLCVLNRQLTPRLLLVSCPCEIVAKAWQLFNWYGGGPNDPTLDEQNRDSRNAHHKWFRVEDRCVYLTGSFNVNFGRGASEVNRFFAWLVSPSHESQSATFDLYRETHINSEGINFVPLIQNDKVKKIAGCDFPFTQHVDNFHPRLSGYAKESFVFHKATVDDWLSSLAAESRSDGRAENSPEARRRRTMSNQEVVELVERYKREGHADYTKRAAADAGISTARVRQLRSDPGYSVGRNSWTM